MAIGQKKWAIQDRPIITPEYLFSLDSNQVPRILELGLEQLKKRFAATHYIVMPHLNHILTGRVEKVDGFVPTVENMIAVMLGDLEQQNVSTAKTKIWKPSRPVIHAVAAVLLLWQWTDLEISRMPLEISRMPLGKRCYMPLELFLFQPENVNNVIKISEIIRVEKLPKINQFRIAEEETIQFVLKG
jgi:hypothetical protein